MTVILLIYTIFSTIPLSNRGAINMTLFSECNINQFMGIFLFDCIYFISNCTIPRGVRGSELDCCLHFHVLDDMTKMCHAY